MDERTQLCLEKIRVFLSIYEFAILNPLIIFRVKVDIIVLRLVQIYLLEVLVKIRQVHVEINLKNEDH